MPRQGQYAVDIVAEICPVGQSGWHGARPYTDGAVTHSNQHRAKIIGDWEKETEKHNTEYGYDKDAGPADFVDWEYSEKKGFFSWLFNDDTINDYSDLTDKQEEAYDDFLFELDKEGLSPIG